MLHAGDLVPHFTVTNLGGERFAYSTIWQRKNLVLVRLPDAGPEGGTTYVTQLTAQMHQWAADDTECVFTRNRVTGIPDLGVVVADRWGEIRHIVHAARVADLPGPADLIDWLDYLQRECPECQGEAK